MSGGFIYLIMLASFIAGFLACAACREPIINHNSGDDPAYQGADTHSFTRGE